MREKERVWVSERAYKRNRGKNKVREGEGWIDRNRVKFLGFVSHGNHKGYIFLSRC